jgi:hypothetical protein
VFQILWFFHSLAWVVNHTVEKAAIYDYDVEDPAFGVDIVKLVRTWTFRPIGEGAKTTEVLYPVAFGAR